jgi:hypothetical protein
MVAWLRVFAVDRHEADLNPDIGNEIRQLVHSKTDLRKLKPT